MSRKMPPCKGCKERAIGCHGKCGAYREWVALRKKRLNAEKAEREVRDYEVRNVFYRQEGPKKR